jgi:hypothetical protein
MLQPVPRGAWRGGGVTTAWHAPRALDGRNSVCIRHAARLLYLFMRTLPETRERATQTDACLTLGSRSKHPEGALSSRQNAFACSTQEAGNTSLRQHMTGDSRGAGRGGGGKPGRRSSPTGSASVTTSCSTQNDDTTITSNSSDTDATDTTHTTASSMTSSEEVDDGVAPRARSDGRQRGATARKRRHASGKHASSNKKPAKRRRMRNPEENNYIDEEYEYYRGLSSSDRRRVANMERQVTAVMEARTPIRFRVLLSNMDLAVKAVAIKKITQLYYMDGSSDEYHKLNNWIEALCKLPIGRFHALPVTAESSFASISNFLNTTKARFDQKIFGHDEAKHQIVRLLARWISNGGSSKGLVIGIHGKPGCGKTALVKNCIAQVLNLPFQVVALGGANDGSMLLGHSYTYLGATYGRIASILMAARCMNPLVLCDEVDKVSNTARGQEVINTLIHLTDSTQNECFHDAYFGDVGLDMSRAVWVFTFNDDKAVSPILLDRMVRIRVDGYTHKDKIAIGRQHLMPEILAQYNMGPADVVVPDDVLLHVIHMVEEESGVRNLKRGLDAIVSNINLHRLLRMHLLTDAPGTEVPLPVIVTCDIANRFVKRHVSAISESARAMYL